MKLKMHIIPNIYTGLFKYKKQVKPNVKAVLTYALQQEHIMLRFPN